MDLGQDRLGEGPGAFRAAGDDPVHMRRIVHQAAHFALHGSQFIHCQVGQALFEVGKLLAAEFFADVFDPEVGERRVDAHQVGGFGPAVEFLRARGQRIGIGFCLADFFGDELGVIGHGDTGHVRRVRLAHFGRAVTERHHPCRGAEDQRLDDREEIDAEIVVELLCDVADQFKVLFLVFADGHVGAFVQQDVGGHQVRVGIEADGGVFLVLAGLFLELGHAVEPPQAGHAIEDPGQLRVAGHLALVEDDVALGVDAGGQHRGGDVPGVGFQLFRVLPDGDGVQVDDAEQAFVIVLQPHPVANGAQVIAEMQITRRLHAGKNTLHGPRFPVVRFLWKAPELSPLQSPWSS